MAVNFSTTLKNSIATTVLNTVDGGAAAGYIEICTASYAAVLATIAFNDPSGTVSNGVLTFAGFPKTVNASASGTAAIARIKDSNGTVVIDGLTVGLSGNDLNFNTTSFSSGSPVTLNSAAITIA